MCSMMTFSLCIQWHWLDAIIVMTCSCPVILFVVVLSIVYSILLKLFSFIIRPFVVVVVRWQFLCGDITVITCLFCIAVCSFYRWLLRYVVAFVVDPGGVPCLVTLHCWCVVPLLLYLLFRCVVTPLFLVIAVVCCCSILVFDWLLFIVPFLLPFCWWIELLRAFIFIHCSLWHWSCCCYGDYRWCCVDICWRCICSLHCSGIVLIHCCMH